MLKTLSGLCTLLLLVGIPLLALQENQLPPAPGAALVAARCATCHDLSYVLDSAGITPPMWDQVLTDMERLGMELIPAERQPLLDYLASYLGPDPPSETEAVSSPPSSANLDGGELYSTYCAICHQLRGEGLEGQFPPLADNPGLFQDRFYTTRVMLHGLQGEIEVKGRVFNSQMPAFSSLRNGQIAAIANYLVRSWADRGQKQEPRNPISAEDVSKLRLEEYNSEDLLEMREQVRPVP